MALITSALERERDLLQKEVLKFAGVEISTEMEQQLHAAKAEIAKLKQEKQRVEEDALVRARLCQDQIDAEQLKNHALQLQLEAVRDKMGAGIDDLKVQVCQEKKKFQTKTKKFFETQKQRWNLDFEWLWQESIKWSLCFGLREENPKSNLFLFFFPFF